MKIAQRFIAGNAIQIRFSPVGTAEKYFNPKCNARHIQFHVSSKGYKLLLEIKSFVMFSLVLNVINRSLNVVDSNAECSITFLP